MFHCFKGPYLPLMIIFLSSLSKFMALGLLMLSTGIFPLITNSFCGFHFTTTPTPYLMLLFGDLLCILLIYVKCDLSQFTVHSGLHTCSSYFLHLCWVLCPTYMVFCRFELGLFPGLFIILCSAIAEINGQV